MIDLVYDILGTPSPIRNGSGVILVIPWLIMTALIVYTFGEALLYRLRGLWKIKTNDLYYQNGKGLTAHAGESFGGDFPWWVAALYFIINMYLIDDFIGSCSAALVAGFAMVTAVENELIRTDLRQIKWEKFRAKVDGQGQQQEQSSWEETESNDDDFFKFREDPTLRGSAPYGFENRHPDDAKLWAVVDDNNAPATMRREAFAKVLSRIAKRNGQSGTDLIRAAE